MTDDEARLRCDMRRQIIEGGAPPAVASEIVDIGFHAANSALSALHDTVFRPADERVTVAATCVAVGLVIGRLQALQLDINGIATSSGLKPVTVSVGGEAHG